MAFIKRKNNSTSLSGVDTSDIKAPEQLLSLARKHNIEVNPLDIAALVYLLGISLRFEPMGDEESGKLHKCPKLSKWVMTINSLHHPNRQRFTMAHELGHHVLHGAISDEFIDKAFHRSNESNYIERQANEFAAELLMPKDDFIHFVSSESNVIEDIANNFQVSTMAVRVRAKQLGFTGHNL
ncbi:ImmA/IrrE family metallo-endopeptidase [Shewanella litorisediminis]|uniref:ImmA/IrrE family metallo-endopeptidase n=1 Tax=Shewanella litorisediminis TaxID=1173586 RepID=A0ABX7G304_9GAMM|nr:ImmA/IrrE family metallo-endopeptidase [Shewanella litorisediminis]MCL2917042.1 ImmA/IrrE family metallo-endopeptidase [Shewanella litorisediminis]QRH01523.1 ImmA/IrrE family metallo-endopeptidase [Shewanella litorisediminis]